MNKRAIFSVSVLMSFIAFGLMTKLYLIPTLDPSNAFLALQALVAVHAYRFVGLAFLMPGVVAEGLAPEFARPAAYGDLIAAVLAVIAALMLNGHTTGAVVVTWGLQPMGRR